MSLTPAQIKLMEENRRKALEKRAAKLAVSNMVVNPSSNTFSPKQSFSSHSNGKGTVSSFYSATPQSKSSGTSAWKTPASSKQPFNSNKNTPPTLPSNRPAADFQLISRTKFSVEAPFDNEMIEIFKKFPSKTYDGSSRKWTFSLSDHQRMLESLNPLLSRFQINPLPKFVLDVFRYI